MKYTQAEIRQAAQQADISDAQQAAMFSILQGNKQASGGLGSTLLLWFGGLLILSALRWPLQRVFENDTNWTQAALSAVVVIILLVLGLRVYFAQNGASGKDSGSNGISPQKGSLSSWSSDIVLFFALASISVLVATVQICLGWKSGEGVFFLLSHDVFLPATATLLSASTLLYYIPHRIFAFVVYASFWLASMSLLYCLNDHSILLEFNDQQSAQLVGILILLATFILDHRYIRDYAAIGYIIGALSLWAGLAFTYPISELDRFLFFLFNIFFIGVGFVLSRYVFIVLGCIGSCVYLEHIADKYMDEIYYQITMCGLGLVVLLLGLYVHKHRNAIMTYVQSHLPKWIVAMRPVYRQ